MTLSDEAAKALREWLDLHEYDIAEDREADFGEMLVVFREVMGREPSIFTP